MTTEDTTQNKSSTRCRRCSRILKNPNSIVHGYGRKCYCRTLSGDTKRSKERAKYPRTISDKNLASLTVCAIYRIVSKIPHDSPNIVWKCFACGNTIDRMPLESYDSKWGMLLPGFGKPQTFFLHDEHCDRNISDLRIFEGEILDAMKSHGDIPQNWGGKL